MAQKGNPLGSMIIDIGLDGSNFSKSLDGIKRQMKAAQNEMKANLSVISQAGDGYKTMEAKVNGLTKVMAANEKQIEILHEKYQQAKKDYGENSKQAQKYAAQINDTVAKQSAMQKQLEASELAMRDFQRGTNDTRTQLDQVARSLTAQVGVLRSQGKEWEAGRVELEKTSEAYKLQSDLVDKEKAKLQDLIKVKGKDSRETKEQRTVIDEAVAKQKLMGDALDELRGKYGNTTKLGAKFADGMAEIKTKMQNVSDQAKELSGRLTGLTAGVTAFGALSIAQAGNVESAQNRIQAAMGLTEEEAKKLQDVSTEVFKNGWSEDITDASNGVIAIKQQLTDLNDADLQDITESGFMIRDLWGYDIPESTRATKALMQNFGVDGKKAMDMIVKSFQLGGDYSGDLLDTINEYSPQFAAMGFDAEKMFEILVTGAQNGAFNLDKVGDAVKEFNIRAQDGSKTTAEGFEAIGLDVDDMSQKIAAGGEEGEKAFMATVAALAAIEDPVKRNQAGVALFGTQWEDLQEDVVLGMASSEGAMEGFEGAADSAKENLKKGLIASLKELYREGQTALQPLGEKLGEIVEDIIPPVTSAIKGMVDTFVNMPSSLQNIIVIIGTIVASFAPLIAVFGVVASGITKIAGLFEMFGGTADKSSGKFSKFKKIFDVLKPALLAVTSPIGLVVAGISALVAGFVLAYKKSETFRNFINGIGESIKNMIPPEMIDKVKSFIDVLVEKFNQGKDLALQAFGAISDFFSQKISEIKQFWDENGEQILQAFSNIFNAIKTVVVTVFNVISTALKPVIDLIQASLPYVLEIFKFVFNTVLAIVKSVWENIKGIISGALDVIMGVIKIFSGLFTGDFSKMWEGIKQVFFGAIEVVWNWVQLTFFGKLLKGVAAFGGVFKSAFSSIWNAIKTIFSTVIKWVVDFVKGSFTKSVSTVKGIFTGLRNFISTIWNGIKNVFWTVIKSVVDFVKSRFTNLKNNTTSIFSSLRDAARKIWTSIKDNIINPIKNAYSSIVKRFENMRDKGLEIFRNMKKKVKDVFEDMVSAIKGLPKRMGDGLKNNAKKIASGMKSVSKFLLEGLAKGVNGVTGGINWILDKVHAPKKLRIPKWEIPEYAQGTDNHPGGLAKVSDGKGRNKRELIRLPNGQTFLSPAKEAILNLPKGTSVLDGDSTAAFLKGKGIPAYAKGKGILQKAWGGAKNLWGKVKDTAATVWDYASDPLSLIKTAIDEFTDLGSVKQPALGIAKGAISKATDGAKNWIKGLLEGGDDVKSSGNPTADVKKWVTRAMEIAGVSGKNWMNGLSLIAMRESGGNPKAQNNWDINAKRGIPSKGLMQTIEPTFNAFKKKGYGNIFNPVHNILAAIGYIKSRYKTIGNVPGVKAVNQGKKYVGYENGGFSFKHKLAEISEGNKPEAIVPLSKAKRGRALSILAKASEIVGFENGSQVTVNNDTSKLEKLLQAQLDANEQNNAMMQQMLNLMFQMVSKGDNSITITDLANVISNIQGKQFNSTLFQQGGA